MTSRSATPPIPSWARPPVSREAATEPARCLQAERPEYRRGTVSPRATPQVSPDFTRPVMPVQYGTGPGGARMMRSIHGGSGRGVSVTRQVGLPTR